MRVLLVNPNTNAETTAMMRGVAAAAAAAPGPWEWCTLTAARGSRLIDHPDALAVAAAEVQAMAPRIAELRPHAVIVAAFGDPGLQALRAALPMPVVGIGESAMQAADRLGQPFSILSITPLLRESTLAQLQRYGCARHFNSLVTTPYDPAAASWSAQDLRDRVLECVRRAVDQDGSRVLVIGGGPVAAAAQELAASLRAVAIQPLAEAVRQVAARVSPSTDPHRSGFATDAPPPAPLSPSALS